MLEMRVKTRSSVSWLQKGRGGFGLRGRTSGGRGVVMSFDVGGLVFLSERIHASLKLFVYLESFHRFGVTDINHDLCNFLRVFVVSHGLNTSIGHFLRVRRREDTRTNKNPIHSELHHKSSVSGRCNPPSREICNREAAHFFCFFDEIIGCPNLLGVREQLIFVHRTNQLDLTLYATRMTDGLNDISGSSLTLSADHGSTFLDAAKSLSKVARPANKGSCELVFVNVMILVRWGKNLALINEVNVNRLQNLRLDKVPNTHLRHHRNLHSLLDFYDHLRAAHSRHASMLTDFRRNALQGHHSTGTCVFCDACLLGVHHVHDDAAFEHLGEAVFYLPGAGLLVSFVGSVAFIRGRHGACRYGLFFLG
mmetsp:Transcript_27639/g.43875  ORF Transcript_27639/g.43875 Transcript_27639/m.43875 type:complete len:365 (-) Transcript_27639:21-1115(-)